MTAKTILWVEDDADLVAGIKPLMEREGWTVHWAASASEGKEKSRAVRPDLIVMDVIMAGQHGFSATEDLKSRDDLDGVPVIIYSSVTDRWGETTASRHDGMLSSAEEFVDKANGPSLLLKTIRKYLS